jgi:transcriptional regulator with PAS, ATPase and Fis domain
MKNDLNDLKKLTMELMKNDNMSEFQKNNENLIQKIYDQDKEVKNYPIIDVNQNQEKEIKDNNYQYVQELDSQETLSLHDKELELIKKSLERHDGKRKLAAEELGISERTLYRKIKQFDL